MNEPTRFLILGTYVKFVKSHAYLGITLDATMSLLPLLKAVKKRISNKIFMLRKIRKYLNFDAAVAVYKQTILPIVDYAGFLLLSCNKNDIDELQIIQNDVLRVCNRSRLSDRVSVLELHKKKKSKILGLKQLMHKQLLWIMFVLSRDETYLRKAPRETRSAQKLVFKVPTKILPVYERSPYYQGVKLWDSLDKEIQKKENVILFKKEIEKLYKEYLPI